MTKSKQPITELLLELTEPAMKDIDGKNRAQAAARLIYNDGTGADAASSKMFQFTAPMGPIEREELSWYLERYHLWPSGVFRERAKKLEALLPVWGKGLYDEVFNPGDGELSEVLQQWQKSGDNGETRRFTVYVVSTQENANVSEAASRLLTLPWELLHNGSAYLFKEENPVQVRRRLPNEKSMGTKITVTEPPIRVLLVSPRPEDQQAGYFDHRISALPLVSALESLGDLAELTILTPPTFEALKKELSNAKKANKPYHVVHFDGHGAFVESLGVGGLCFEDPEDIEKLQQRKSEFIDANQIGAMMSDYDIPLVFLEACQSGKADMDPGASVAATLLHHGVVSVVAMSHTVLVETTRRFVTAFYGKLAEGRQVGEAMSAGRGHLQDNPFRFKVFGAGELALQDWFVPVLYQEKEDLQLLTRIPSRSMREMDQKAMQTRLGAMPEAPPHGFVGRSRELLVLERLLARENYAVVLGQGGEGKTTLAVELVRWLVRTQRFGRAVFVCLEDVYDIRAVVDSIGRQLLPHYSVAQYENTEKALLPIEGKLREMATLVLLDNMESLLPPTFEHGTARLAPGTLAELFSICQRLGRLSSLIFTSREPLGKPFDSGRRTVTLSRLYKSDAVALVHRAMREAGLTPLEGDDGAAQPEVEALVEAVACHARSLVVLAPYISRMGVRHTTEVLDRIMKELDKNSPNQRERSLNACLQLSLQFQQKIRPLGAFQEEEIKPKLKCDISQLSGLAKRYVYDSDKALKDFKKDIEKRRRMTKCELCAVGRWKSRRSAHHILKNTDEHVCKMSKMAFAANSEPDRIKILDRLHGVGWSTASVILHFFHKDQYPIIDFRALWSVSLKKPNYCRFGFWWQYVEFCRALSEISGLDMRTLDKALWQYSKEDRQRNKRARCACIKSAMTRA